MLLLLDLHLSGQRGAVDAVLVAASGGGEKGGGEGGGGDTRLVTL